MVSAGLEHREDQEGTGDLAHPQPHGKAQMAGQHHRRHPFQREVYGRLRLRQDDGRRVSCGEEDQEPAKRNPEIGESSPSHRRQGDLRPCPEDEEKEIQHRA